VLVYSVGLVCFDNRLKDRMMPVVQRIAEGCQPWCFVRREDHPSTLMKLQVWWPGRIVRFLWCFTPLTPS